MSRSRATDTPLLVKLASPCYCHRAQLHDLSERLLHRKLRAANLLPDPQTKLFDHLQRLSFDFTISAGPGSYVARHIDVDSLRRFLGFGLSTILSQRRRVYRRAGALFHINALLAMVAIVTAAGDGHHQRHYSRKLRPTYTAVQQQTRTDDALQENIVGIRLVRPLRARVLSGRGWRKRARSLANLNLDAAASRLLFAPAGLSDRSRRDRSFCSAAGW